MKLSSKFFCIAYLVVLLSTGFGGSFLINRINDTLWNTQVERAGAAVRYAADSFLSFADLSYHKLSDSQRNDAVRQIKRALDGSVSRVEIHSSETVDLQYAELEENECVTTLVKKEDKLWMESVCKLNTGLSDYYLFVFSDFTEVQNQRDLFWKQYGIVVICISAISGLLLFVLTKRITKPLDQLTKVADEIALGNYGKRAKIPAYDDEISLLSERVNSMSAAIEQKMKEIREELEKRSLFVANFTHEIKTPMTAIIGYAQMLRSYELNPTEKDQASEAIWREASRLEKLSLQLLELYVYQNDPVEMERVDLEEVEKSLNITISRLSEKYRVAYAVDFEKETVFANSTLLLSMLYNLADNAFKASKPGGRITISGKRVLDTVWICVKDEGRGIAEENLRFLTEPFYREDKSRSRRLGGAGLGLALCKEIAEIHGTELRFESEKGKGTQVSFVLSKGGSKE